MSCHMVSGKTGHAFLGSHDMPLVKKALTLGTCREPAGGLRVTLENRGATHNVPTGGVVHRMVLRVWKSSAPDRLVEEFIGRRFEPLATGGKRKVLDTTISAGEDRVYRVEQSLGPVDEPVNIELRYIYSEHEATQLADGTPASRVVYRLRESVASLPLCTSGSSESG